MTTTLKITPVRTTAETYRFTSVEIRDGIRECLIDLVDFNDGDSCEVRVAALTNAYNKRRERHQHLTCMVVFQAVAELRAELGTGFSFRWDDYPRNALRVFALSESVTRQPGTFSRNEVHTRGEVQSRLAATKNNYVEFLNRQFALSQK